MNSIPLFGTAVSAGTGGGGRRTQGSAHRSKGITPPPDHNRTVALKHRMVTEQFG